MSDIRQQLLSAQENDALLLAIGRLALGDDATREDLSKQMIALHNAGAIDLVDAFSGLKKTGSCPDFFLTRYSFEQVLPALSAPTKHVMQCCAHLTTEAGQDLAAGSILSVFADFLAKDSARAHEALREIEADVAAFATLLVVTLIAGSRSDVALFLDQAIRLMSHPDPAIRANALYAVGRVAWTPDVLAPASLLAALERIAGDEADDRVLASALKSTVLLWAREPTNEPRWAPIARAILERGGPFTLHAAAEALAFEIEDQAPNLSDLLLRALHRVSTENAGTIKTLDFSLLHLLQHGATEKGIEFLEAFLVAHAGTIEIEAFPSTIAHVRRETALTSKLLTRWLSGGKRTLCTAVHAIVSGLHEGPSKLRIDLAETDVSDPLQVIFVARKAIGYLFLEPQHCVAIVASLMTASGDAKLCAALADLLYDTVLINFSGVGRSSAVQAIESTDPPAKTALQGANQRLDAYLHALPDALPALRPSQAHREAARRRMSEQVRSSMRAAEKKSTLLSLFKKSVLLYGRTSIHYVDAPDAPRRVVMPLHRRGTSVEVPRLSVIDPVGLDHMLRVFRYEQRMP